MFTNKRKRNGSDFIMGTKEHKKHNASRLQFRNISVQSYIFIPLLKNGISFSKFILLQQRGKKKRISVD